MISIFLVLPAVLFAQSDTLVVTPTDAQGALGAINRQIMGDTTETGERIHKVYKLQRGAIYFLDSPLEYSDFTLTIVADEDDPSNPVAPPVLAPGILADNSSTPWFFILHDKASLTLKNLYLQATRPDGITNPGTPEDDWAMAIFVMGDSLTVKIDNCVFDSWENKTVYNIGLRNSFFFTDNVYRNLQYPTNPWGGQVFESDSRLGIDSLVVTNCTIFNKRN